MIRSGIIAAILALCVMTPTFGQGGGLNQDNGNGNGNGNGGFNGGRGRNRNGPGGFNGGFNNFNPRQRGNNNLNTQQPTEDYQILNNVSIFAKDRRTYDPSQGPPPDPQPRPRQQGPSPVLRGVVTLDAATVAQFEYPGRDGLVTVQAGDTIDWDGSKVKEVSVNPPKVVLTAGNAQHDVALGQNLNGETMDPIPVAAAYQSQDVYNTGNPAANNNANNFGFGGGGRRGRGGGGGGFGGGFGIQGGGNGFGGGGRGGGRFNGPGGNGFGGNQGAFNGQPGDPNANTLTGALVNPSLDPPLPGGSADSIAQRMMQRRQQQVSGQ